MKKLIASSLLIVCIALMLTACGGTDLGGGGGTGGGTTAGTTGTDGGTGGESNVNDTIIWVQSADITSLDPHVGRETVAIAVTGNIFDSMLAMIDGRPEPALAHSWENIDPVTWRFFIRDDVHFHDGVQLTSADIAFSIERAMNAPQVQFVSGFIESVHVVDEFTVDIVTHEPFAPILSNLAMPMMGIVPMHLVEADEDHFVLNPVGTGPYRFVEWRRGESARLEANPDYFRGEPLTRYLEMRVVPEAAQRTIAIETGEAHFAFDLASTDVARVRDNPNLSFYEAMPVSSWFVIMNMEREPLNDIRVRQAIRYALNVPDIITAVRHGLGEAAHSFIPPVAFGHSTQAREFHHNLDRARELMAEASVDNVSLSLFVSDAHERIAVCTIIQAQLLQIGIDVDIRVLEFGTWLESTGNGDHDMTLMVWSIPTLDADYNLFPMYHSDQLGSAGNRSFLVNDHIDSLIMEGRSTVDPARRQEIYDELAAYVSELSPSAYVFFAGMNVGASNRVNGFNIDPNGYHRLHTVWID